MVLHSVNWGSPVQTFLENWDFDWDLEDEEIVLSRQWSLTKEGYVRCGSPIDGRRFLHNILLSPEYPLEVDHINGNRRDNQRSNLRVVTHQQNMHNRKMHRDNTSGWTGVQFHNGAYQALIRVDYKLIYLGRFCSGEEAHEAYLDAKEMRDSGIRPIRMG